MVEMGGIGNPCQPVRLHAHCHSQARRMRLEIPAHPPSRVFDTNLQIIKKPPLKSGFFIQINTINGGDGGNRTPVRKSSTDSSTYLALLFDLICTTPTDKRCTDELP
jgi:hypothetical protein